MTRSKCALLGAGAASLALIASFAFAQNTITAECRPRYLFVGDTTTCNIYRNGDNNGVSVQTTEHQMNVAGPQMIPLQYGDQTTYGSVTVYPNLGGGWTGARGAPRIDVVSESGEPGFHLVVTDENGSTATAVFVNSDSIYVRDWNLYGDIGNGSDGNLVIKWGGGGLWRKIGP
jgi:hypothetical protein